MATEICTSDWDLHLPLGKLFRHRAPIRSDAGLMNRKLGVDLLLEILIRLPNPRSACHCKLVCRLWRSVISDVSFNRRYVSHHQPMSPNDLKSMILSFLPPMAKGARDAFKVFDCNRDLVLCGFWDELINTDDGERSRSYLLCNPFTKQWAALPLAPKKSGIYSAPAARLVFEPQTSPPAAAAHRFRVVYLYHQVDPKLSIKLDVFCSESGEWIKDAVVHDDHVRSKGGLVSWNGELLWVYRHYLSADFGIRPLVAVFDLFRLDVPPTSIDIPSSGKLAVSQGALHAIVQDKRKGRTDLPLRLSVWRLGEDRKSWKKKSEGLVNKTSKCRKYETRSINLPVLHPQKPEIVFFNWADFKQVDNVVLSCDLTRGEVEYFAKLGGLADACNFFVFQPRVSNWVTPIPKLDNMYKENISFLLNYSSSSDPTNPDDAAALAPAKVRRIKKRRVDAAFAPAKGLLLSDSNSKVRRVKRRRVASGLVQRKPQVLGSKHQ